MKKVNNYLIVELNLIIFYLSTLNVTDAGALSSGACIRLVMHFQSCRKANRSLRIQTSHQSL